MATVVLVIGACGVGKTSALARMRSVLGPRVGEVAVVETDTVYQLIDPTWSLPYDAERHAFAGRLTARIVAELVAGGFTWVAVGSNGLQDRASVDAFVAELPAGVEAFHVLLDPAIPVVQGRIALRGHEFDAHKTPQWVAENVRWMRGSASSWMARIDNSELTVDETVEAIYATVHSGAGRLTR